MDDPPAVVIGQFVLVTTLQRLRECGAAVCGIAWGSVRCGACPPPREPQAMHQHARVPYSYLPRPASCKYLPRRAWPWPVTNAPAALKLKKFRHAIFVGAAGTHAQLYTQCRSQGAVVGVLRVLQGQRERGRQRRRSEIHRRSTYTQHSPQYTCTTAHAGNHLWLYLWMLVRVSTSGGSRLERYGNAGSAYTGCTACIHVTPRPRVHVARAEDTSDIRWPRRRRRRRLCVCAPCVPVVPWHWHHCTTLTGTATEPP